MKKKKGFKLSAKEQVKVDLTMKSLIGKKIKIINSKIENQIGVCGELVYETANFLILEQNGVSVQILKSNVTIGLEYKGQPLYMDGRFIISTLTQRIKKYK